MPVTYTTKGGLTITYNGVDLTPYVEQDEAQAAVQTIDVSGVDWNDRPSLDWTVTLTFIRVRPAAPIRACLWRRNLDGGHWRKRGHPAHRK
jgi:hypothetical protein